MLKYSSFKRPLLLLTISLFIAGFMLGYCVVLDYYKTSKRVGMLERAVIKPVKVFQIGFSKCGTATLAGFFNTNGVRAIHHHQGHLAATMYVNNLNHVEIISPEYQHYSVYTDMENMVTDPPLNIGMLMFKDLDKQYPGSKFILNVRDKQAWLKSRSMHPLNANNPTTILEINTKTLRKSEQEVLAQWSKEWDDHHKAVIEYFKDRPNDLIVFDIDKDKPEKLVDFFKDNFVLNAKHYKHINKTSEREALLAKIENGNKLRAGKKHSFLKKFKIRLYNTLVSLKP